MQTPSTPRRPPMRVGQLIDEQGGRFHNCECRLSLAVNELRSQLDRQRKIGAVNGQDAAADAIAAFENANLLARAGEIARGSEAGGSGTDDVESVMRHAERSEASTWRDPSLRSA